MTPDLSSPAAWLPRTPFWSLVAHFMRRLFAAEGEESDEGISLGLGVVLAILALPGAFASLFLLDKYSTLLQWLRGQRHFDFYQASAADEYFFVVLSMTITGLVMVMRWNRLFPDRRDFANLAILPIPIRHVFLANFTALLSLALLFAVDVNLVSTIVFPAFVTISDGSLAALLQIAAGHLTAVFSASLFAFFGVFALVGLLSLLLPGWLLRPVSVAVRILLAVGLLVEFFSNMLLQLFRGQLPAFADAYIRLLPSFWFLGVYETVVGIAKPVMVSLGQRALLALGISIVVAVAAYALCYRRHFLRLAESFDTLTGTRHGIWLRMPEWLARVLFRTPFEEACLLFAFRVLTRSERHVMFLGGYLGVGFVWTAQEALQDPKKVPLLATFFLLSGLRFAFDIPASTVANWCFRFSANDVTPSPNAIARRLLLLLILPWQLLPVGSVETMILNVAFSILAIDFVLLSFERVPFTYYVQPDTRKMVMRFVVVLLTLLLVPPFLSVVERWASGGWGRFGFVSILVVAAWWNLRRRRLENQQNEEVLSFDERSPSELQLLHLA